MSSRMAPTRGCVYFAGTNSKLWRINLDGSEGVNLGNYQTDRTPFVAGNYIYFQGTDNTLWRINLDRRVGFTWAAMIPGRPRLLPVLCIYFRGTDEKLWQITLNGTQGINLGGYKTYSTPVVTSFINSGQVADNFVFFQGTDNSLWRINLDGSGGVRLGGYNTASPPLSFSPPTNRRSGLSSHAADPDSGLRAARDR